MTWTTWIAVAAALVTITGTKVNPPPVVLELGPVVPTPAPTPKDARRKRLITVITVQNSVEGETIVSFEASDVADDGHGKTRTLASKSYSLAEMKPETKAVGQRILERLRDLERDMLDFAKRDGPPKERAPIGASGGGASGGR